MKYPNIGPGQEVEIDSEKVDYFMACCDCHSVHLLRFRVKGKKVYMRGWKDKRKTASLRRYRGIPIKEEAETDSNV